MSIFYQLNRGLSSIREQAEAYRRSVFSTTAISLFSDRIRPGTRLRVIEDRRGLFGIEFDDPIGEAFRRDVYKQFSVFSSGLFNETLRELETIRGQRHFGGEDQVQHSLLIGSLQNLLSAFSLFSTRV